MRKRFPVESQKTTHSTIAWLTIPTIQLRIFFPRMDCFESPTDPMEEIINNPYFDHDNSLREYMKTIETSSVNAIGRDEEMYKRMIIVKFKRGEKAYYASLDI